MSPSCSGYGFINFDSDQTAIIAMHRMGGKVLELTRQPGGDIILTFFADRSQLQPSSEIQAQPQLHSAGSRRGDPQSDLVINYIEFLPQIDTSIWVGDLTPEVDDFALYRYFTTRYGTVRCAKVWSPVSRDKVMSSNDCRSFWTSLASVRATGS